MMKITDQLTSVLESWMDDAQDDWEDSLPLKSETNTAAWVSLLVVGAVLAGTYYFGKSRKEELKDLAVQRLIEQPAEQQSFSSLKQQLEESGLAIVGRATQARDTEGNRKVMRHIIGIERWGRARLQSAVLLRPWVMDEHYDYRPPKDKTLGELAEIFAQQRERTVALAQQLHENPPRLNDKIPHNEHGPLSVRAWLRYLYVHANLESRRIR